MMLGSAAVNSRPTARQVSELIQLDAERRSLLRRSYWSMSLRLYSHQSVAWRRQMDERSIHSSTACTAAYWRQSITMHYPTDREQDMRTRQR